MSNELVSQSDAGPDSFLPTDMVVASKYASEEVLKQMTGSGFLPRIQLMSSNSKLCKRGQVAQGTYAVMQGKENIVHKLGEAVNMLILGWRPRAIRFGDKPISIFNPNDARFKQIEVDSEKANSKCMYGPEYLVYIPEVNVICTFHFNNPTMRQAAAPMGDNVSKAVTCRVELIEKPDYSWHGPVITVCSTPLAMPTGEERTALLAKMRGILEKFNNPSEKQDTDGVEDAPDGAEEPARAR